MVALAVFLVYVDSSFYASAYVFAFLCVVPYRVLSLYFEEVYYFVTGFGKIVDFVFL